MLDILADAQTAGRTQLAAWKRPRRDLDRLVRRDYIRDLRKRLGYGLLGEILKVASRVWPNLNQEQLTSAPAGKFTKLASRMTDDLRIHFQAKPHTGNEGMALRGFYVENSQEVLRRPLIYVNTAHHPVAVSATFCHELGHHLTSGIFKSAPAGVHFFFDANYASHLDDATELAPDILVSLAAYPKPLAERLFRTPWKWGLVARTGMLSDETFKSVREHVRTRLGLNFAVDLPAPQKINYLAGMIHYAKLRWALLEEYDL